MCGGSADAARRTGGVASGDGEGRAEFATARAPDEEQSEADGVSGLAAAPLHPTRCDRAGVDGAVASLRGSLEGVALGCDCCREREADRFAGESGRVTRRVGEGAADSMTAAAWGWEAEAERDRDKEQEKKVCAARWCEEEGLLG